MSDFCIVLLSENWSMREKMIYRTFGKRLLDLAIVVPVLILSFPSMFFVALLVRINLGSPIFFRQPRPGLHGHPFRILKFRTMTDACDRNGQLLPDSQRLTRLGNWLRSTSLDELPELFNVLLGQMSLVGPRPLLMQYLPLYTPEQARRHEVYPGLTGWAQINGRNAISWSEKFALDVWYVDNLSPWLDLKIMLHTLLKILRREGINQEGVATVEPFAGSPVSQQ
jgi:sugar transferase EpsL